MTRGIWPLLVAIAAVWGGLYLVSQVLAQPALPVAWTVLAGVVLTDVVILGWPSVLRGPRQRRRGPLAARDASPAGERPADLVAAGSQMPYLREGLTMEAARQTVHLLRSLLGADAVAITDLEQMLAFEGAGADHHQPGSELWTPARGRVIASGRATTVSGRWQLGCPHDPCPLASAAIAPLRVRDRVVGTISVYRVDTQPPRIEPVEGLAGILSLHLELAELDRSSRLSADAKLDALRAQINPHFLFNTLNTIAAKARTDPEEARALLLRLADFFRYAIQQHGHLAEFAQEYFFVRTYLTLEQARFGDRLTVRYDVDPQVLAVQVPVLTIQPLVENAVKHGLSRKVGRGTVTLRARVDPLGRAVDIQVRDDGVGMDEDQLRRVLDGVPHGSDGGGGVGLSNISERLALLFGDRYEMDIRSRPEEGTMVRLRIPVG